MRRISVLIASVLLLGVAGSALAVGWSHASGTTSDQCTLQCPDQMATSDCSALADPSHCTGNGECPYAAGKSAMADLANAAEHCTGSGECPYSQAKGVASAKK